MKNFTSYLKKAFGITLVLIVLCGVVYPLVMTGAGQLLFKKQANGSMIEINGKKVGSELIGQEFEGEQYFQGRVSSVNYNVYSEKEKGGRHLHRTGFRFLQLWKHDGRTSDARGKRYGSISKEV